MTIVAYKNGILAADSCISSKDVTVGSMRKVIRTKSGELAGVAGNADGITAFLSWAYDGFKVRTKNDVLSDSDIEAIVIGLDGVVRIWESKVGFYRSQANFYTLGSGFQIAMGAMAAGASAKKAVEITCRLAHGCAPPVVVLNLVE